MTASTALAYIAHKTIVQHPAETIAAVKTIVATAAPVALPIAAVAGVGYGIYKLVNR